MTTKNALLATSSRMVRADAEETEAERQAREDKARKDASSGVKENTEIMDAVSRMADACERMADRMDRQDARMDAVEGMIKDAAKKDEDESEEDKKKRELESKADAEKEAEAAADKARKDAEEKEEKERADKARKDAEGKEGEREEHADSVDMAKLRAEVAALKNELADTRHLIPRQITDEDGAALAGRQSMADSVYIEGSFRAPSPMLNESLPSYRRRIAMDIQQKFGVMKGVDFLKVADSAAFDHLEHQLYLDAVSEARKPSTVGPMQVRAVKRTEGGHEFVEYHGDSAGWMGALSIPAVRGAASVAEMMKTGYGQR